MPSSAFALVVLFSALTWLMSSSSIALQGHAGSALACDPRQCAAALLPRCSSKAAQRCSHFPLTLLRRRSMAETSASLEQKCDASANAAELQSSVVSAHWLHEHLNDPNLKVLDASWYMPAESRNPLDEFMHSHIPGALFFDVDAIVDSSVDLPHMLPSPAAFSAAASSLGLKNTDAVVVYDGKGIFSAARAWWMFKVFGHDRVYVLNGGLPEWLAASYPVDSVTTDEVSRRIHAAEEAVKDSNRGLEVKAGQYKATFRSDLVWSLEQVRRNVEEKRVQIVDARSKARFDGVAPEPRKGVRAGHIPGSRCVPFTEVLESGKLLASPAVIASKFKDAGLSLNAPIVASCGTGVTACILALALEQIGIENVPVYDGSWTEWGGRDDTPVSVCSTNSGGQAGNKS